MEHGMDLGKGVIYGGMEEERNKGKEERSELDWVQRAHLTEPIRVIAY